jgi:Peptidase family M41/Heat induced stress protein YflT domain
VSEQGVSGIYDSISKAKVAVDTLDRGGFPIKQVSIVAQHLQSERRVNGYVTVSDAGRTGAMTGAWLGGLLGLLTGVAFMWMPGFGPLIVARHLASALLMLVGGVDGAVRSELLARLAVMLAGRTAEEIVFDDVPTGAESDLTEATRLARRMVTRWGMGDLGLVAFQADEEHPFLGYELAQGHDYSEATAARIDQEVQRLLAERHAYAGRLLTDARELLDHLAQALWQAETLDLNALTRILGPRPATAEEKLD